MEFNVLLQTSDARLKENIQDLEVSNQKGGNDVKNIIDDIKVYSFTYKNNEDKRIHYGVLAQELQEIVPELVYEDFRSNLEDKNTYYLVNYIELIPHLIAKCHQQDKIIKEQGEKINELIKLVGINDK